MALVNEIGYTPMTQDWTNLLKNAPAFATTLVMDAGTELIAFVGEVWHPTVKTGTINIRKVHFRCGAVTQNVLSTVRLSLQNISLTAGPPYQPDTTQDQTFDYVGAVNPLTANAMNVTGNLSADRAVDLAADSIGDTDSRWLCVVWEYAVFTAADSVIISSTNTNSQQTSGMGGLGILNTGTWGASLNTFPNVIFECDDGTFAFMQGAFPFSAYGSATTANNATFRAIGVKFQVPTARKIDRASLAMAIPNGCDGDLILYDSDGTTVLASVAVDNDAVLQAGGAPMFEVQFPPVTLTASTYYRFVFVPSTTTAATLYHCDVGAAGHMDGAVLGQSAHYTTRDSGGTWTDTTTRRPAFGLGFCAYDNGAGGSGGGLRLAGHGGLAA